MTRSVYTRIAAAFLLAPLLLMSTACSTAKPPTGTDVADDAAQADPLEGFNRVIFSVNETLDHILLRPIATIYKSVIPAPVRKGVTNALTNAWQPIGTASWPRALKNWLLP